MLLKREIVFITSKFVHIHVCYSLSHKMLASLLVLLFNPVLLGLVNIN